MPDSIPTLQAMKSLDGNRSKEVATHEAVSRFLSSATNRSLLERSLLPGEEELYRNELYRWCALFPPTTELECCLIGRAIHNSIKRHRANGYMASRTEFLSACAGRRWDLEQKHEINAITHSFWRDPAAAVSSLKESAAGCRWLINCWMELARLWDEAGTWHGPDCDEAIALLGFEATAEGLRVSETAYLTQLYCVLAKSAPKPDEITALLSKEAIPASLVGAELLTPLPSRSESRERLGALVDRELGALRRREERLRVESEEPTRAAEVERALKDDSKLKSVAETVRLYDRSLDTVRKSLVVTQRLVAGTAEQRARGQSPSSGE